jgi:hypothetical protein
MESMSDSDGVFSFEDLPDGSYRLEVTMAGFQTLVRNGIKPDAGHKLTLVLQKPQAPQGASARPRASNQGSRAQRSNGSEPDFPEIDLSGAGNEDLSRPQTETGGFESGSTGLPTSQDNSDLLVISGSSSASVDAGNWNDPQFRDRIRQMAEGMGFGGFMGPGGDAPREMGSGGPGGSPAGPIQVLAEAGPCEAACSVATGPISPRSTAASTAAMRILF